MAATSIVRVVAKHRRDRDEHLIYALRLDHVDLGLLQAQGYDLVVDPLLLDEMDPRVRDAETASFFAVVRAGWAS